jgi:hypothetical protein
VAVVTGHVRRLLAFAVPTVLVGAIFLWPVLRTRLSGFGTSSGLPQSWQVRLDNLRGFVWPEILSGFNWLFGVRPAARIQADVAWGPYIYVESGHTWLLWTGGIPFLLAFGLFTAVAVRRTALVARHRHGPTGAAGVAACATLLAVFLLMSFDPHITMRGTADLLFSLLALAVAVPSSAPAVAGPRPPAAGPAPTDRREPPPGPSDVHSAPVTPH